MGGPVGSGLSGHLTLVTSRALETPGLATLLVESYRYVVGLGNKVAVRSRQSPRVRTPEDFSSLLTCNLIP